MNDKKFRINKTKLDKLKKAFPKSYSLIKGTLSKVKTVKNKKDVKVIDKSFKKIIKTIKAESKKPAAISLVKSYPKTRVLIKKLENQNAQIDSNRPLDSEPAITKICFAFGMVMLVAIINVYISVRLNEIFNIDDLSKIFYIVVTFISPLVEETCRIICEGMFTNGALYFSAVISIIELFERVIMLGKEKRLFFIRILSSGLHFLNGFIQKILIKYFGVKGGIASYIITVVLHGLWNGGVGFKIQSVVGLTTKDEEKEYNKMIRNFWKVKD